MKKYNIGITTIFSFRPHVEYAYYIADQLKKDGHSINYLGCKGDIPSCYNYELKQNNKKWECFKCVSGSLFSYDNSNFTFLDSQFKSSHSQKELKEFCKSSSYTLTRIEDPLTQETQKTEEIQNRLSVSASIAYENTKKWVQENNIEIVYMFNGRMDVTRGILEALIDLNIPYLTMERTWFGPGLMLKPKGNCLSLQAIDEVALEYLKKPLTKEQAIQAASNIANRFAKKENLEWRNYHQDSVNTNWPINRKSKYKILILPSSRNEIMSHEDWSNNWKTSLDSFEKTVLKFGASLEDCVVRAHPHWAEYINKISGKNIDDYYRDWCKEHNITYIGPEEKADTANLMKQADFLLLNGSSAIYESALIGKPSICLTKCAYTVSEIATTITSEEQLQQLDIEAFLNGDKKERIRKTLRFLYLMYAHCALFSDSIKPLTITKYQYNKDKPIDTDRLIQMAIEQRIIPDDDIQAESLEDEDFIIDKILNREWDELVSGPNSNFKSPLQIKRRGVFKAIDYLSDKIGRGDKAHQNSKRSPKL